MEGCRGGGQGERRSDDRGGGKLGGEQWHRGDAEWEEDWADGWRELVDWIKLVQKIFKFMIKLIFKKYHSIKMNIEVLSNKKSIADMLFEPYLIIYYMLNSEIKFYTIINRFIN